MCGTGSCISKSFLTAHIGLFYHSVTLKALLAHNVYGSASKHTHPKERQTIPLFILICILDVNVILIYQSCVNFKQKTD